MGLSNFIAWSYLPLLLVSVHPYLRIGVGSTTAWWFFEGAFLIGVQLLQRGLKGTGYSSQMKWIHLYLVWNLFCIARGCFVATTYWDWKGLAGNSFGLLLPSAALIAFDLRTASAFLRKAAIYTPLLFPIFFLLIPANVYGFYFAFLPIFLLFLPYFDTRWKAFLIALSLFAVLSDLGARSTAIRLSVAAASSSWFWLRWLVPREILELVRKVLILSPFCLLALAAWYDFNIFQIDKYVQMDASETKVTRSGETVEEDLKADTRTPLYLEVIETARKYDTWWFGRTPAKGNETKLFEEIARITGVAERQSNEAAILNIFTWTGIVGVLLYCLVFYHASWLALNDSNNYLVKAMGILTAFRWAYSWVEEGNQFNLSYLSIWITIGFCCSREFRMLSDQEVFEWLRQTFGLRKTNIPNHETN
ncbi:MAG: hypothetical protein RL173_875 [Fibrobacterota bacterium]|jgi:hypothetical protein